MAGVTFLDSSGLRVLMVANELYLETIGTKLTLRAVPDHIRRILDVAGVDAIVTIID